MANDPSIWPAVIQAATVSISALAVSVNVAAWRRSVVGKRKVEIAESALDALYRVQGAVRRIRNPAGFQYERDEVKKELEKQGQMPEGRIDPYVTLWRMQQESDIITKVENAAMLCRAYFGKDAVKSFEDVRDVLSEVRSAARMLIATRHRENLEPMRDKIFKWESAIWSTSSGSTDVDPLDTRIDSAVVAAELFFRRVLDDRHPFWAIGECAGRIRVWVHDQWLWAKSRF